MSSAANPDWIFSKIFRAHGPAAHRFDERQRDVAAVQHRQRQQVEQGEIHIENDAEPQHAPPAVVVLKQIAINADDHHRAAELLHADLALLVEQRAKRVENLRGAGLDLLERFLVQHRHVRFIHQLHHAEGRVAVGRLQRFYGQQRAVKLFAAALDGQSDRLHRTVAPGILQRKNRHRMIKFFAIQRDHFVAAFKPASAAGLLVATS